MQEGCRVGHLRGDDSTGMFQIPRYSVPKAGHLLYKRDVDGVAFAKEKRADTMFRAADTAWATVLHHRAATAGTVTCANAHPFTHGDAKAGDQIVGVHNGTLAGSWDRSKFDVDSDYLYSKIWEQGAETALSEVNGAYALVWWDQKMNAIRIASNGQRSIYWAPIKGSNAVLVASELHMLAWLADRNGMKIEQALYPSVGSIYNFILDKDFQVRDIGESVTTIPEKPKIVHASPAGGTGGSNFPHGQRRSWEESRADAYRPPYKPDTSSDTGKADVTKLAVTDDNLDFVTTYERSKIDQVIQDMGFTIGQEVEFVLTKDREGCQYFTDIQGLAESAAGLEMVDALILGQSHVAQQNLADAWRIYAKVFAFRRVIDKVTGEFRDYLVLEKPHRIEMRTDVEGDPLDEIPGLVNLDEPEGTAWIEGPRRIKITTKRFNSLTKDGCASCQRDLTPDDANNGTMFWMGTTYAPVCMDCQHIVMENAV
jgi:hypothetical protein